MELCRRNSIKRDEQRYPKMNFSKLAPVWHFFKNDGLTPEKIEEVQEDLRSPVMVGGGGIGMIPTYLFENGFDVASVDSCKEMVMLAAARGVFVHHCDIASTPFKDQSFSTVILSTGTVQTFHIYDDYIDIYLSEVLRLLKPGGKVIVAYIMENPKLEQMKQNLGLNEVPSNNALFLESKDMMDAARCFINHTGIPKDTILKTFVDCGEYVVKQLNLIREMGKEIRRNGSDPKHFVSQYLGFKNFRFTPKDEDTLIDIASHYFTGIRKKALSGNNVHVLIGERPA